MKSIMRALISLKAFFICCFLLFCSIQMIIAQDYNHAIGLRLGTYIGASYTSFQSENRSIEGIAGIKRQANQTDYVFGGFYKFHVDLSADMPSLNCYAGLGSLFFIEDEFGSNKFNFAPSAIIGLEYSLEQSPINFFIDMAPHFNVTTKVDSKFNVHANIGVRYILSKNE